MPLVFAQSICNGTADAMNFRVVKITLVIVAIVLFVELLIPNALMTLKKLNTIQSNFLNFLVNSLKMLKFVTNSTHNLTFWLECFEFKW